MSVGTSRWATPVASGAERVRSIGWWGMALGALALLLFQATLVAAYLYVRWGHTTWPPPPFQAPGLAPLAVALLPITAAAALMWSRSNARSHARPLAPALAGAALLGAIAIALRVVTYVDAPFAWNEHAYASLFWVLGWYEIVALFGGVVIACTVLVQAGRGIVTVDKLAVFDVAIVYWWFTAVTSLMSLTTLYLGARL